MFEVAAMRYLVSGFPFSPVKTKAPVFEKYFPSRLRTEKVLPEHVKMKRKLTPEQFEEYRKKWIAEQHKMWKSALGME